MRGIEGCPECNLGIGIANGRIDLGLRVVSLVQLGLEGKGVDCTHVGGKVQCV